MRPTLTILSKTKSPSFFLGVPFLTAGVRGQTAPNFFFKNAQENVGGGRMVYIPH